MDNFSLKTKSENGVAVMIPRGYINSLGAERLEQTGEEALGRGVKKLVVDFSEVQFINTIGVSIFSSMIHKTRERRGTLCFMNVKKIHRDIFETVGLARHVRIFRDEEEALNFLGRPHDR